MSDKNDKFHQLFPEEESRKISGTSPEHSGRWIEYVLSGEGGDKDEDREPSGEAEDKSVTRRLSEVFAKDRGERAGKELEERDFRPVRVRRDSRTGCLGGLMYAVFVICLSVGFACIAWLAASDVLALNKEPAVATVVLPKEIFTYEEVEDENGKIKTVAHADIDYIATALKDGGIIEYPALFKFYASISNAGTKLDPGSYELSTEYDYRALVKKMQVGSEAMLETTVVIPEGYTMAQIFEALEANDVCTAEELYDAAANYNFSYTYLGEMEIGDESRLEGFLFPDTYNFYQGEEAANVINRMLLNLHYKVTAEMYTKAAALNITFRQAVVIASMIEKEAANDSERAMIASVIFNRLSAGMPLQIDATIQYILPERKPNLSEADLAIDSPYNTYMYTGLPPGAISNPGMASINAALNPAVSDYYYYALNTGTGEHEFFVTYEEARAFADTQDYD